MKIYEGILLSMLGKTSEADNCQSGCNQGRSTTEAIFIMKLFQKFSQKGKHLYHIFVKSLRSGPKRGHCMGVEKRQGSCETGGSSKGNVLC